jgi:hypothetical protein
MKHGDDDDDDNNNNNKAIICCSCPEKGAVVRAAECVPNSGHLN